MVKLILRFELKRKVVLYGEMMSEFSNKSYSLFTRNAFPAIM